MDLLIKIRAEKKAHVWYVQACALIIRRSGRMGRDN